MNAEDYKKGIWNGVALTLVAQAGLFFVLFFVSMVAGWFL